MSSTTKVGLEASRPANARSRGSRYIASDTNREWVSDGVDWIETTGGGGGAADIGFGDVLTFGNMIATIHANNTQQNLKLGGGDYSLSIANPLPVDAWVSGVLWMPAIFVQSDAYVGPMHYREQLNVSGGTIALGSALVSAGSMDAGVTGPAPPDGQLFLPEIARPFGIEVASGDSATLDVTHLLYLADDGSAGTYQISFNGSPRLVYSGVPLA